MVVVQLTIGRTVRTARNGAPRSHRSRELAVMGLRLAVEGYGPQQLWCNQISRAY